MRRVLVLVPTLPKTLDSRAPWHFFQEITGLARRGINLCVASTTAPDYEFAGIEFRRIYVPSLRRQPMLLRRVGRSLIRHRGELPRVELRQIAKHFQLVKWNLAVLDIARDWRPDLIHSHWAFPSGSGGALAARELGVPLIMTLRGIEHLVNRACAYGECLDPYYEATLSMALQQAKSVTICCSNSRLRLEEMGVYDASKTAMIYHAVGSARFRGLQRHAEELKLRLGLHDRLLIVCVAGMDHAGKGQAVLLEAFCRIRQERPEAVLLLVGDGPLRATLEATARAMRVSEHVRFVGRVHPMEVQHYMRMASLTVLPTFTEVFGNVVFESLYVGTPVVASAIGTPGDVLPVGPYGCTFEAGDVDGLVAAMREVIEEPSKARQMALRGGDFVRSEMTVEKRTREFLRIYEELTCSSPAPAEITTS